jgi:hypothetical protein
MITSALLHTETEPTARSYRLVLGRLGMIQGALFVSTGVVQRSCSYQHWDLLNLIQLLNTYSLVLATGIITVETRSRALAISGRRHP